MLQLELELLMMQLALGSVLQSARQIPWPTTSATSWTSCTQDHPSIETPEAPIDVFADYPTEQKYVDSGYKSTVLLLRLKNQLCDEFVGASRGSLCERTPIHSLHTGRVGSHFSPFLDLSRFLVGLWEACSQTRSLCGYEKGEQNVSSHPDRCNVSINGEVVHIGREPT